MNSCGECHFIPETYRTVSLIPFQAPCLGNLSINDFTVEGIHSLTTTRGHHESRLVGKTKSSFRFEISGAVVDLDTFDNNVGIITITREHIIDGNISTEEQIYSILAERKEMHRKFRDGSDPVVSTIESAIKCNIPKPYTFTLYVFPDKEWVKPELLMAIFQPSMVGMDDSTDFDEKIEKITPINAEWPKNNNSDIRNGVTGLISWSSVIVIAGKWDYVKDYVYLEKRLQHVWLNLYINMDHLSKIIQLKSTITSQEINRIRVDATFEVLRVDEILDPSFPDRHLTILEKMIETSNFDKLKQKIDDQLKFFEIKAMTQRDKNNENFSRTLIGLTSFLFIIAIVTAYRSLFSLMVLVVEHIYSNLLEFIVLVAIFAVFMVIIFKRFEKE